MKHDIHISAYSREDNIDLIETSKGAWWLRCHCGLLYFWNPDSKIWEIGHVYADDMSRFDMTEEEGLKLLKTIDKLE